MSLSNTQLAQQASQVLLGHQSFVTQTINWLTSIGPTVRLQDPYDPAVFADVKTPQALQAEVDALTGQAGTAIGDATALLNQANALLADASQAATTFETYNTTFVGLLTSAQIARDAADAARDGAETFAGQAQAAVSSIGTAVTDAQAASTSAEASAVAAAASAAASAASATASAQSALTAATEADEAEAARIAAELARDEAVNAATVGPAGASAYEIAVANGFVGSEAQWLASLQGEDGVSGTSGQDAVIRILGTVTSPTQLPTNAVEDDAYWVDERSTQLRARLAIWRSGAWVYSGNLLGLTGDAGLVTTDIGDLPDPNSYSNPPQVVLNFPNVHILEQVGGNLQYASFSMVGPAGPSGATGPAGPTGADGLSAYQVAVANGYIGTEVQWLNSLNGPQGPQGPAGPQGPSGASGGGGVRRVNPKSLQRIGGSWLGSSNPTGLSAGTFASGSSLAQVLTVENLGSTFVLRSHSANANSGARIGTSGSADAPLVSVGAAHCDVEFAVLSEWTSANIGMQNSLNASHGNGAYLRLTPSLCEFVVRRGGAELFTVPTLRRPGLNEVVRLVVISRRTGPRPYVSNAPTASRISMILSNTITGEILGVFDTQSEVTSWSVSGALCNAVAWYTGSPVAVTNLLAVESLVAGYEIPPGAEEPCAPIGFTVSVDEVAEPTPSNTFEVGIFHSWSDQVDPVSTALLVEATIEWARWDGQGAAPTIPSPTLTNAEVGLGNPTTLFWTFQHDYQAALQEGISGALRVRYKFTDADGRVGYMIRELEVAYPPA